MRHVLLVGVALAAGAAIFSQPPIPQGAAYHNMVDSRSLLGVPYFLDVASNAAFAVVGMLGFAALRRRAAFADPREAWPYAVCFAGVMLTAVGSSYYHLAPDNDRLVWDRLPMAIAFTSLLAAVVSDRVNPHLGRRLLAPLVLCGIGSVAWWAWTEARGVGDLRAYLLVQFGSLLLIVLMLVLYRARYTAGGYIVLGLAAYGVAKVLEVADARIFAMGGLVSGHTLKHLVAAAGIGCLVVMLWRRSPTLEVELTGPRVKGYPRPSGADA